MNHVIHNQRMHLLMRSTVFVLILAILFVCSNAAEVFASTISIGGNTSVNQGDTFTVSVTFSGDNIGRVDGQMTYDSSVLSYLSGGTSSGDNGYIELRDAGTGGDLTFTIKFKAVGGGSSGLNVSTNGVYNLDEEYMDAPSASKTITVAAEETTETTEETSESTEATEETSETTEATEVTGELIEVDPDTILPENESDSPSLLKMMPFIVMTILILAIILVLVAIRRRNRRRR